MRVTGEVPAFAVASTCTGESFTLLFVGAQTATVRAVAGAEQLVCACAAGTKLARVHIPRVEMKMARRTSERTDTANMFSALSQRAGDQSTVWDASSAGGAVSVAAQIRS